MFEFLPTTEPPPAPTPPSRTAAATRARIIDAALQLSTEQGPAAVTVRAVARAAGVNTAAVNYHFGGKDQALLACYQPIGDELAACFNHLVSDGSPAADRLARYVRAAAEVIRRRRSILGWLIARQMTGLTAVPADYRRTAESRGLPLLSSVFAELGLASDPASTYRRAALLSGALLYPLVSGAPPEPVPDTPASAAAYVDLILKAATVPDPQPPEHFRGGTP